MVKKSLDKGQDFEMHPVGQICLRPFLSASLPLPSKELGSWPLLPAPAAISLKPHKPVGDTVLLPQHGRIVGWVWHRLSSNFSQCVDGEQGPRWGKLPIVPDYPGYHSPAPKSWIEAAVRMQSIRPQTIWQIRRGVFWLGKADIQSIVGTGIPQWSVEL